VTVEQLLASKEIVVTCGAGGVGKTTTAAALGALAVTRLGGKVLVLTVDPARRLADALGVGALGNVAVRVPDAVFTAAGVPVRGELWAAMLDTKQGWDDLVGRHAPDAATRDAILANPLYRNVTGKFVQSHDYVAMERLYELHASGENDLIIVDTPPSRHAVDFLDAPSRMADFFTSRFLRLLVAPARSRMANLASRPFYAMADRILGSAFVADIGQFFVLFQSMYDGFVERANAVERVLHDRRTTFVVVTTLEAAPAHEAERFVRLLAERQLHLGAVVLNKVLPSTLLDPAAAAAADRLRERAEEVAIALDVGAVPAVGRVLTEVADSFGRFRIVATREAEQRAELARAADELVAVPQLDDDVADLAGLLRLADLLAT
jgi:anion-transporting  ArsA/GET3 family ATPase